MAIIGNIPYFQTNPVGDSWCLCHMCHRRPWCRWLASRISKKKILSLHSLKTGRIFTVWHPWSTLVGVPENHRRSSVGHTKTTRVCLQKIKTQEANESSINGLVWGKIYRKAPYLMGKSMASCKFSLKPIQSIKNGAFFTYETTGFPATGFEVCEECKLHRFWYQLRLLNLFKMVPNGSMAEPKTTITH